MLARTTLRRTANRLRFAAPLAVLMLLLTTAVAQADPSTPTGVTLDDKRGSNNGITVDWANSTGADCYFVYRSTTAITARDASWYNFGSCWNFPSSAYTVVYSSKLDDSNVVQNRTYHYAIRAVDEYRYYSTDYYDMSATSAVVRTDKAPTTVGHTLSVVEDTSGGVEITFDAIVANDTAYTGHALTVDRLTGDGVDALTGPMTGATVTTPGASNKYRYTPAPNFFGTDTFQVRVCESATRKLCSVDTITVNVTPDNDAPVVTTDVFEVTEDSQSVDLDVTANDNRGGTNGYESAQILTPTIVSAPASGVATVVGTKIRYTPAPNFVGNVSMTYSVCDNGTPSRCSSAGTATIKVLAVNDAPIAVDDNPTTTEDTPVTFNVRGNDTNGGTDEAQQVLVTTILSSPSSGTLVLFADGTATFAPASNAHGTVTFTYKTCESGAGGLCSNTAAVRITVTPVNDTPVATNDEVATDEDTAATFEVVSNDSSGAADESNGLVPTELTQPSHGTAVVQDGAVRYTPEANYNGPDSFTYRALETVGGALQSNVATVSITVHAVNDAPVATSDEVDATEDTPASFDVLANDHSGGGEDNALEITDLSDPAHGTASVVDGRIAYQGDADFNGEDTLTYTVHETVGGNLTSAAATVTIDVAAENDSPVAADDTATTDEDMQVAIDVVDNDSDGADDEHNALEANLATTPANGSVIVNGGTIYYTPSKDFNGTDTFTYFAQETEHGALASAEPATVTVTVNPVNDAPITVADSRTTAEDTSVTIDLVENDGAGADDETAQLLADGVTPPLNGTVTYENGSVTYAPNTNFHGTDTFTYAARETGANGLTSAEPATVTITVTAVNDAPIATDDPGVVVTEDDSITIDVVANDSSGAEDENNALVPSAVSTPANGTATVVDGAVLYAPKANFAGTDSFTYVALETVGGELVSVPATVTISVTAVNDAPVVTPTVAQTDEDTLVDLDVLGGDTVGGGADEASSQALHVEAVLAGPSHGTLVTANPDGTGSYRPDADFFGTDVISYSVCDNGAPSLCTPNTLTITVHPVNDAPTVPTQQVTLAEDTTTDLDLLEGADAGPANETGDELSVTVTDGPSNGTLVGSTYRPTTNFEGSDVITTRVCDGGTPLVECSVGTINIAVTPVNDAPVAVADSGEVAEDAGATSFDVLDNDTDVEGDDRTVSAPVVAEGQGTASVVDGEIAFTPAANFHGTASIDYTVTDDGVTGTPTESDAKSDEGTLTITVTEVNDAVSAEDDVAETDEDTAITLDALTANDSAGPANEADQSLAITSVGNAQNGVLSLVDGGVVFTPDADYFGPASFTYTVSDDGTTDGASDATSDTATVNITVLPVNDAPIADADAATTDEDTAVTITDLLDGDVAGPANEAAQTLTITSVQAATNGTVTRVNGTTARFTPAANFNGTATFTYTVSDGSGAGARTDTETVTVTVAPVNDAPTAAGDTATLVENTSIDIDVLGNDTAGPADESNALEPSDLSAPAHGTVTVVDGKVRYTPTADYNGMDTFTYTAHETSDGSLRSAAATVTVTVTPSNTAPLATDGAFSATEGETTTIDLSALVADKETGDAKLTYVIDQQPTNGTLSGSGATRTYTSNPGFGGVDTIRFHVVDAGDPSECGAVTPGVCENKLASNVATLTLNVTARPVAVVTPPAVEAPGQADVVDRTKPTVSYASAKLTAAKARKAGLTVQVKTNVRAKTVVTIYLNVREAKFLGFKTTKPIIVGTGVVEGNGGIQNVKIKLTFKGKLAIARRSQPTLHLMVRAMSTNANGTGTAKGTLTIIKPKG